MINDLLAAFDIDSQNLLQDYEQGKITLAQWRKKMKELLAQYHLAGMMAGMGTPDIPPEGLDIVRQNLNVGQYPYLDNFATVMAAATEFNPAWKSRVRLYSLSPKQSYQEGKVWRTAGKFLPLPAMPAQGVQCVTNCGCDWRIDKLDGDDNWDCYWVRAKDDSCQTCIQREKDWSPISIRDGILMPATYKHLAGQHDQASHGYRFGKAPTASRARQMKREGTWGDYVNRARARQGSPSKAEERRAKKVNEANARIKEARDVYVGKQKAYRNAVEKVKAVKDEHNALMDKRNRAFDKKHELKDKLKKDPSREEELGELIWEADGEIERMNGELDALNQKKRALQKEARPAWKAMGNAEKQYLESTARDRATVMRHERMNASRVRARIKNEIGAIDRQKQALTQKQVKRMQDYFAADERGDTAEVERLKKLDKIYTAQWNGLNKKKEQVLGLLSQKPTSMNVRVSNEGAPGTRNIGAWQSGVEVFSKLAGRNRMLEGNPPEIGLIERMKDGYTRTPREDNGRSFHSEGNVYMSNQLMRGNAKRTAIHELGHALEYQDPAIQTEREKWFTRRTANSPTTNMRELFPESAYSESETTKPDEFLKGYKDKAYGPYVGKLYSGRDESSEVISIGIELFYADPVGFARADPDMFDFVYAVVRMGN